jgi:hypothetical protein
MLIALRNREAHWTAQQHRAMRQAAGRHGDGFFV